MHLRISNRDDLPAILAISNWAAANTPANFAIEPETLAHWTESWDQTHAKFPWLVAEDEGGAIIGFAKASPHKGRCAYAWTAEISVYVHPEHHGRGIGTALYGRLIPTLRAQGYITLIAGITTPNPASERLHRACGFEPAGVFKRVGWKFGRWHDVAYLELLLESGNAAPRAVRPVNEVWRAPKPGHSHAPAFTPRKD